MEIPIVVEPLQGSGFRASSGVLLGLESEAPTREEAVEKLRDLIDGRLNAGVEIRELEVGGTRHPLAPFAGTLKDDPLLQPLKDAIAEYRQTREDDE
jgi:hypothetical protein